MARKVKKSYETEKDIFPTRLRELMKEKDITQTELATKLNITRQAVSLYTTGQSTPDINILLKLANYFDLPADYLIGRINTKKLENASIEKEIGLTDEAVNTLKKIMDLSKNSDDKGKNPIINTLNLMLNSYYYLPPFLIEIQQYMLAKARELDSYNKCIEDIRIAENELNASIIMAKYMEMQEAAEVAYFKVQRSLKKMLNFILGDLDNGEHSRKKK